MGRDKKQLVIRGKSFLDRAFTVLTSAGAGCVLLSGVNDAEAAEFRGNPVRAVCVPDVTGFPRAGGPPKALYSVLEWLRINGHDRAAGADQLLAVIPVDMPLLTGETLEPLTAAITRDGCEAAAYRGEVFPLVLKAGPRSHQVLKEGLEREARQYGAHGSSEYQTGTGGVNSPTDRALRFSMKTILATLDTVFIDPESAGVADTRVFSNVNTPEELKSLSGRQQE